MTNPNRINPVKTCSACGRQFAHVRGFSESTEVCGVCLARRCVTNDSTRAVHSPKRATAEAREQGD